MNIISKVVAVLRDFRAHPINRNRKNRAILEYGFIQLAARFLPGDVCVELPNRTRLLIPTRMKGAAVHIAPSLYEFEEMAFTMHYLRKQDKFADVGANIGIFTLLAVGVTGCRAQSFEPNPEVFAALARNIRLNDFAGKVKLANVAVGRSIGHIQMSANLGTENYIANSAESVPSIPVNITTLDAELSNDPADLIKIDVEGFEKEVFAGATSTLQNQKLQAILVERNGGTNRYGFDEEALHLEIRNHGFKPCQYDPFTRKLSSIGNESTGNIIYVRNFEAASERLKSAPLFHLNDLHV